jgi:hypothetical protein
MLFNIQITLWSWALLERLPVVQALDRFPAFYGSRRFITAFTRALQLYPFWVRPIQFTLSHTISSRSILILPTYLLLDLPSVLLPSMFYTNNLYTFLLSPIRATCTAQLILSDLIIIIIIGEGYKSLSSSLCSFLHLPSLRPSLVPVFKYSHSVFLP